MAALDFPGTPLVGDRYPIPPVAGIPTYTWDGEKWTTSGPGIITSGGASAPPLPDGAAAVVGTSDKFAREDHVHPEHLVLPVAATYQEFIANSQPDKMMTSGAMWAAVLNWTALVEATNVATPNMALGLDFLWQPTGGGKTLANPQNAKRGQKGLIYLNPSVATFTVTTWGSAWKFPNAVKPVLTARAGALDIISYSVFDPTLIACVFLADVS